MKKDIKVSVDRRTKEFILFTPYNLRHILGAMRSRRWDLKTKTWRVPMLLPSINEIDLLFEDRVVYDDSALHAIEKIRGHMAEFLAVKRTINVAPEDAGYKWRTRPRSHQVTGTRALLAKDFVGLFDVMGLGKSKESIDAATDRLRRRQCSRVVILCPASLKFNWGGDEDRGIDGEIELHAIHPFNMFENVLVVNGTPKKREAQLREAFKRTWIVMNYELAKIHIEVLQQLVKDQYLICDEAHRLKNMSSQTYKAVKTLKPKYLNLLTGTPVANRPEDIYAIANMLEPGLLGGSFGAFKKSYTQPGGFQGKEIVGYRNLSDLKERVQTTSIRRRIEVLTDLPPKTYEVRRVDMEGDQLREYKRMRDDMVAFYRDMPETDFQLQVTQAVSQVLRLQQIADGFLAVADRTPQWYTVQPKLTALDEIVEEVCEREKKKLVVWSRFLPVTSFITDRYKNLNAVRMSGEINANEKSRVVNEFKTNPDCKLFVSQVHTGGLGLTLTCANTQVFYDRWWSPSVNEQAEARLHRIGTMGTVLVVDLLCRDSIDENVRRLLSDKQRWADEVTGDPGRQQISKADILELLK